MYVINRYVNSALRQPLMYTKTRNVYLHVRMSCLSYLLQTSYSVRQLLAY